MRGYKSDAQRKAMFANMGGNKFASDDWYSTPPGALANVPILGSGMRYLGENVFRPLGIGQVGETTSRMTGKFGVPSAIESIPGPGSLFYLTRTLPTVWDRGSSVLGETTPLSWITDPAKMSPKEKAWETIAMSDPRNIEIAMKRQRSRPYRSILPYSYTDPTTGETTDILQYTHPKAPTVKVPSPHKIPLDPEDVDKSEDWMKFYGMQWEDMKKGQEEWYKLQQAQQEQMMKAFQDAQKQKIIDAGGDVPDVSGGLGAWIQEHPTEALLAGGLGALGLGLAVSD